MTIFRPTEAREIAQIIAGTRAAGETLDIVGGGSKRAIGRATSATHVLETAGLNGIIRYEPSELVLVARAGTPLATVEAAVSAQGQMLAFEPPDWGALVDSGQAASTLGGIVSTNLSGPRRLRAGAARDHVLGFHAINGRGESFKSGGEVVKNVTGYDLSKLVSGAWGTLAVLTEICIKVLPAPETELTVLVAGDEDAAAIAMLSRLLNSTAEVTAAAHLPAALARHWLPGSTGAVSLLRLEGPAPSVQHRRELIAALLGAPARAEHLDAAASRALWGKVSGVTFDGLGAADVVWRISSAPTAAAAIAAEISRTLDAHWFYDWGGGLLWLRTRSAGSVQAVRGAVARQPDAHATLVRRGASEDAEPFQPLPARKLALHRDIKQAFDPDRVLNRGRMYAQV